MHSESLGFAVPGPNEDVPAGDIGVSPREVGWMYGQWKRLTSNAGGVLTGKGSALSSKHALDALLSFQLSCAHMSSLCMAADKATLYN